ncbi:type I glutamate--ammonia ligase [Kribbella solani]
MLNNGGAHCEMAVADTESGDADRVRGGLMDKQQEFVLRALEERDVRFVRLWFTDVLGFLKSVAVAPAELENAFAEGLGFDGSAIEGFARVTEADMLAKPDPSTFQILPWRGETMGTARMFCDINMPDGSASFADPRHVLKRTLSKAADLGFTFYTHPEIEFYLFKSLSGAPGTTPEPVDSSGYFDHTPQGIGNDFRREAITMLESMGISVEFSHHEGGPGQQEIDLRYADALSTADNIMTFRVVVKEVALSQGIYASFMPKPLSGHPGSGMHTHMSLFEGDRNAFFEGGAQYQLSKTGRAFIAGLLHHAAEITAVTNQWVNSYKRLAVGDEAPSFISWGHNNRSALVRVPMYKPHKGQSSRVEFRSLDSATNPYLAFALMLAAGLKGIEEGYELPAEVEEDIWSLTPRERKALGIKPLPSSLAEAIGVMEDSELVAETLGEHVFDFFLRNKRAEWQEYRRQVTPFELNTLLPVL